MTRQPPQPLAAPNAGLRRYSAAPYQYGASFGRRAARSNPAQPLLWGAVLTFVPLFWVISVAWFTRMVF